MDYTVDCNKILKLIEVIKTLRWWSSKEHWEAQGFSKETVNDMLTNNPEALKYIEKAEEEKKEHPDDVRYHIDVFHPEFLNYISALASMEKTLEWMIEYTKNPGISLIIPTSFKSSVELHP